MNSKSVSHFRAAIDCVSAGFIKGWVYNPDKPEGNQEFFIAINGRIVEVCVAHSYREDLVKIGMGDGFHGFSAAIAEFLDPSITSEIKLLDSSQREIQDASHTVIYSDYGLSVNSVVCKNYQLSFNITQQMDIETSLNPVVNVYDNQRLVFRSELVVGANSMKLNIPIPAESVDGKEHVFIIGFEDYSYPLARENIYIPLTNYSTNNHYSEDWLKVYRYKAIRNIFVANESSNRIESSIPNNQLSDLIKCLEAADKSRFKLRLPSVSKPQVTLLFMHQRSINAYFQLIASLLLVEHEISFEVVACFELPCEVSQVLCQQIDQLKLVYFSKNDDYTNRLSRITSSIKGEYICLTNAVDEFSPSYLYNLIHTAQSTKAKLVGGTLISTQGIVLDRGRCLDIVEQVDSPKFFKSSQYSVSRQVDQFDVSGVLIESAEFKLMVNVKEYSNKLEKQMVNSTNDSGICLIISEYFRSKEQLIFHDAKAVAFSLGKLEHNQERLDFIDSPISTGKSHSAIGTEASNLTVQKTILFIDSSIPKPDRDAGSYAAIQEIKILIHLGFKVIFAPADLSYASGYTEQLQSLGVEVLYYPFYTTMNSVFSQFLSRAAAVYITRYNVAQKYIHQLRSNYSTTPIIFNNADLHFLREIRTGLSTESSGALQNALRTKNKELAVVSEADAVLSYSRVEHAVISSHLLRNNHVFLNQWVLEKKKTPNSYESRKGIAFLGGFQHQPNVEAVEYFVDRVLPLLVEKQPEIKLYVYGSHLPKRFQDLKHPNVEMVGYVESLDDVFQLHRVFVVPLVSGAGIKGKVLESMAYGLPSVVSPLAAEETGLVHGVNSYIAESPLEWVESIQRLYFARELWEQFSQRVIELARENYSFEKACSKMNKVFKFLSVRD